MKCPKCGGSKTSPVDTDERYCWNCYVSYFSGVTVAEKRPTDKANGIDKPRTGPRPARLKAS